MMSLAIKASKEAGKYLHQGFKKLDFNKIKSKSKHEIVTPFDLKAERIILNAIKRKYPKHSLLSEEAGENKKQSDYLWVVDPLDGTTNFSLGAPLFSVSISLFYKNKPLLGVIYFPVTNQLFTAEFNKGAYLNNKIIRVSLKKQLPQSIVLFCHNYQTKHLKKAMELYSKFKLKTRDFRQFGSAALELALVALGRAEAIIIPGCNSWDAGAGILLVREAGGRVSDFQNKEWGLKSKDMIASNDLLHSSLLSIINQ